MHSYILCFCPCTLQDMLPEYIHMRVAESILFAGKAIRVLRNPSPGATLQEHVNQGQNPKGSHRMQSFTGGSGAPKDLPNFSNISAEELLPLAEADKIDAMLKDLKVSYQPGNYCQQCLFHHHILLHAFHCFAFTRTQFFILFFLKTLYWCRHMAAFIFAAFFGVPQMAFWVCCRVNTYNCC